MVSKKEKIIAVMGPTGAGKSSFIRDSVPLRLHPEIRIGHDLESETRVIQAVRWNHVAGTRVKLVDTPGFDDSHVDVTDAKILRMIATFLTREYNRGESRLSGLIYVHPINNTRMGKTLQRNLELFKALCGLDSLKNVVIVTTMWDMVTPEEGSQHEQELRSSEQMFKPLLCEGAIMIPHNRTSKSAAHVINHLLGKEPTTTLIVREIAQQNKTLGETSAGTELRNDLLASLKKYESEIESLKDELRAVPSDIETQEWNGMVAGLSEQLEELKRDIPEQIGSDPLLRFEPAIDFPVPNARSLAQCTELLQLVKMYQPTLSSSFPKFSSSVASRALRFANAVEKGVKDVQRGLPTLTFVLTSELTSDDVHALQRFMKANPHLRSFTRGVWTKARDGMELVANGIEIMLSELPKPVTDKLWIGKAAKCFDALTKISESARVVVIEMETMIDWWTPVIDALGDVEDVAQCMEGCIGFDNSTVKVPLSHIIRALDSYCKAYAKCHTEELNKAASEILQNFRNKR